MKNLFITIVLFSAFIYPSFSLKTIEKKSVSIISITEGAPVSLAYAQSFGPSNLKTYFINGSGLIPSSGVISISGNSNFEISVDEGITYGNNSFNYSLGTITNKKLIIRLKEGLGIGTYSETISHLGGNANNVNLMINGTVNDIATSFTWTGAVNSDFLNNKNWIPFGLPDANDNVSIVGVANDAIIDQNQVVKIKSISITQGGNLLINTADTVTINGNFENRGTFLQTNTGEIVFAGNWGSLLTTGINGFLTNFTNVTVDKGSVGTLNCNTPIKVANRLRIKSGHFIVTTQ